MPYMQPRLLFFALSFFTLTDIPLALSVRLAFIAMVIEPVERLQRAEPLPLVYCPFINKPLPKVLSHLKNVTHYSIFP